MRKLIMILMLVLFAIFPIAFNNTSYVNAATVDPIILFEGTLQDDNLLKIDVNLKNNTGIYSMLLTLKFDTTVLTLVDLEYGTALQSLEPLASENYLVDPYKISYLGKNEQNDTTTGKMMTLTFSVKEVSANGDYSITFDYSKNKDITFLNNGKIQTKNLVIDGVKVTLKNSQIEKVVTDRNETPNNIVWWVIGGIAGMVVALAVPTILILRKKKGKWIKL